MYHDKYRFTTCIMTFLINPVVYDYAIIVTPYTPIVIMILERSQIQLGHRNFY